VAAGDDNDDNDDDDDDDDDVSELSVTSDGCDVLTCCVTVDSVTDTLLASVDITRQTNYDHYE